MCIKIRRAFEKKKLLLIILLKFSLIEMSHRCAKSLFRGIDNGVVLIRTRLSYFLLT